MSLGVDGALPVLLRCDAAIVPRVRYVFDSLFLAAGVPVNYVNAAPGTGPWLLYAQQPERGDAAARALHVLHHSEAWHFFDADNLVERVSTACGLPVVLGPGPDLSFTSLGIGFDLPANAFYFLSSWSERRPDSAASTRRLYASSDFSRLDLPQDIVDRYLVRLVEALRALCRRIGAPVWSSAAPWPGGAGFALVLSHDVDYLPVRVLDNLVEGAKAVARHLVKQRDPGDAWRAARGWLAAVAAGRDPYGCVPEIISRERNLGLRSSFQVAVGHRHPDDVNYHIDNDRTRDYLRAISDAGFDLCLHGSYRSTEDPAWYVEEVELLGRRLARPLGSRQHFLSFNYDKLFDAQERAGILYDMSMGYPDRPGPRAGFSYPYFPYNLREDRPYRVLQISLFLMDVTLRSYMGLRPEPARAVIEGCLADLATKAGCASAVWHPIVFGNARDPGYGDLYFEMARMVREMGGTATDGRTANDVWRAQARGYTSFSFA